MSFRTATIFFIFIVALISSASANDLIKCPFFLQSSIEDDMATEQTVCEETVSEDTHKICGYQWTPFHSEGNTYCYKQIRERLTYHQAQACCKIDGGGELLRLETQDIVDFITEHFKHTRSMYTGMYFINDTAYFGLGVNRRKATTSFQNKVTFQSLSSEMNCVGKSGTFWYMLSCESQAIAICQKKGEKTVEVEATPTLTVESPPPYLYGHVVKNVCVGTRKEGHFKDIYAAETNTTLAYAYTGETKFCLDIYTNTRYVPVIEEIVTSPFTCCYEISDGESSNCASFQNITVEKGEYTKPYLDIQTLCEGSSHAFMLGSEVIAECSGTKYSPEGYVLGYIKPDLSGWVKFSTKHQGRSNGNVTTITSQCQSRAENCFKVTTRASFHVTTDLEGVRIICSMYDWPDWTSKDFLMGGVNHWTAMNLNTKVFKKPLLTFTLCGEDTLGRKVKQTNKTSEVVTTRPELLQSTKALGGSKMLFYAGCGFGGLLVVVLLWITVALNVAPSEEDDAPAPKKAANVTQNPMETASHARKTPMTKSLAGSPHGGASKTTSRGSFSDHGSTGTEVVNLESAE